MWVTKLLISPVKKKIFCPKTTKFGPKLAFLVNLVSSQLEAVVNSQATGGVRVAAFTGRHLDHTQASTLLVMNNLQENGLWTGIWKYESTLGR